MTAWANEPLMDSLKKTVTVTAAHKEVARAMGREGRAIVRPEGMSPEDFKNLVYSLPISKYPLTEKVWGFEKLLENRKTGSSFDPAQESLGYQASGYCAKLLYIKSGYQSSLHSHQIKNETFIVLEGEVFLEVACAPRLARLGFSMPLIQHVLRSGDKWFLPADTQHRFFSGLHGAWVLEVSAYHDDNDVVRLEESRAR